MLIGRRLQVKAMQGGTKVASNSFVVPMKTFSRGTEISSSLGGGGLRAGRARCMAIPLVFGGDGNDAGNAGHREGQAKIAANARDRAAVGEVDFESG